MGLVSAWDKPRANLARSYHHATGRGVVRSETFLLSPLKLSIGMGHWRIACKSLILQWIASRPGQQGDRHRRPPFCPGEIANRQHWSFGPAMPLRDRYSWLLAGGHGGRLPCPEARSGHSDPNLFSCPSWRGPKQAHFFAPPRIIFSAPQPTHSTDVIQSRNSPTRPHYNPH